MLPEICVTLCNFSINVAKISTQWYIKSIYKYSLQCHCQSSLIDFILICPAFHHIVDHVHEASIEAQLILGAHIELHIFEAI
jgi:hypothetical protein